LHAQHIGHKKKPYQKKGMPSNRKIQSLRPCVKGITGNVGSRANRGRVPGTGRGKLDQGSKEKRNICVREPGEHGFSYFQQKSEKAKTAEKGSADFKGGE